MVSVKMVTLLSTVAVPDPEEALNVTVSPEPGTDAPEPPPDVADQLVVLLQFPLPPATQNRFAMITPQDQKEHLQQARQQAVQ